MLPAVVQGDSLAVGMRPALEQRINVASYNAKGGRGTDEGLRLLLRRDLRHKIVIVSLGTNDLGRSAAWMEQRVRAVVRKHPRCVVWGEVRVEGTTADRRLNAGIRRVKGVRFVRAVRPAGGDGIHLTPQGYVLRAKRFAAAAKQC